MRPLRGLVEALQKLDRIDISQSRRQALGQAAARIEAAVKRSLSHRVGEDHTAPWLRTGELRASIESETDEDTAIIGSTTPVAIYQELGTRSIPPRPFLAPVAAAEAEGVIHDVAHAIRATIEASR